MEGETLIRSINGCARCHGEGHDDLEFKLLTHGPIKVYVNVNLGVVDATHWAPCPTNGEPILMAYGDFGGVNHVRN